MRIMLSLLVMLLGVGSTQTTDTSRAPTVTNDVRQSLAAFRGKIVILNFWATWCGPCRIEIPGYIALQDKYRDQGLEIVGVSIDPIAPRGNPGGAPAVAPFIKENGINYNVWMVDNVTALAGYDVSQGIPTTYVLDREGLIVKKYVGARSFAIFEDDIKQLMSPRPKVECGPWDAGTLGGDDLLYARLINCVAPEGVKRITQHILSPSGDRYVFVGEFWEPQEATRPPLSGQKSDLWVVNINGTGLQRLTTNGTSREPEWSPDGNELVLVDKGSIKVLDTRSKEVRTLLEAYSVSSDSDKDSDWVVYGQPKWSPKGKAIAVVARDQHSDGREGIARVDVVTTDGWQLCHFARGVEHHQWNKEGELVLDYGKFIFDWDGFTFSNRPQPESDETKAENAESADLLQKGLLKRVSPYGAIRVGEYAIAPSGSRIVFAGEFEGSTNHLSPESDLWLVNLDGTGLRRLTENHDSSEPAWSPSGKAIAFVNDGSVKIIDVKTLDVRNLSDLVVGHPSPEGRTHDNVGLVFYSQPRWSSNGKVIAARANWDLSGGWMTAVDARSGNAIFESEPDRWGSNFSWNPKGELVVGHIGKFVFDWDRTFWYGSWPRNPEPADSEQDGSAVKDPLTKQLLERLGTRGVKNIREFFPSPSGERLVFAGEFEDTYNAGIHESDLWLVNRNGSGLRRLTKNHRSLEPAWSPSGNQIAFVNGDSISIIDLTAGGIRRVAGLQAYHAKENEDHHDTSLYGGPQWSPNGKAIAAQGGNGGTSWVTAVEARSGNKILQSGSEVYRFAWNDDSELLLGYQGEGDAKVIFDWTAIKGRGRLSSNHRFLFKQNGKFGYFDSTGEAKVKPQFSDARQFSEGLAPVALDGRWGYINKAGEFVAKPLYDAALPFYRGLARVKIDGRWEHINKRGEFTVKRKKANRVT